MKDDKKPKKTECPNCMGRGFFIDYALVNEGKPEEEARVHCTMCDGSGQR